MQITFPRGSIGEKQRLTMRLRDRDGVLAEDSGSAQSPELTFQYAPHRENDRQARDVEVDREVAKLYVAKARREATEWNRRGNFAEAQRILLGTARRIGEYADGDSKLLRCMEEPRRLAEQHDMKWSEDALRAERSSMWNAVHSRGVDGAARRAVEPDEDQAEPES